MLLPRLAATMLATMLVLGPALAQPAPEAGRCDTTTKRLDRDLENLSKRLVRAKNKEGEPRSVPATHALAELMELEALRIHLRCLGLRVEDER
jgi:hypothetical protein